MHALQIADVSRSNLNFVVHRCSEALPRRSLILPRRSNRFDWM